MAESLQSDNGKSEKLTYPKTSSSELLASWSFEQWSTENTESLNDLLRSLRRKKGFGLFFVQCSPAQATKIIQSIHERFPTKKVERFTLNRQSETLYDKILEKYQTSPYNIACVIGLEQALYSYEDTKRILGWDLAEIYNYSWKGTPIILNHLNKQRELFKENLDITLIFFSPRFVIDYLIQRAPDFFDWRSGLIKFTEDLDSTLKKINDASGDGKAYREYLTLAPEDRIEKIAILRDQIIETDASAFKLKANLLKEQGRLFESNKDLFQALDCYNRALVLDPENYIIWHRKAHLMNDLGVFEEALESYNQVIKINPNFLPSLRKRGHILNKLRRYAEAIENYDRALSIDPKSSKLWRGRGNSLRFLGRYEEAIESYERAIQKQPEDYKSLISQGDLLGDIGRYDEAILSYDKVLEVLEQLFHLPPNIVALVREKRARAQSELGYTRFQVIDLGRHEPYLIILAVTKEISGQECVVLRVDVYPASAENSYLPESIEISILDKSYDLVIQTKSRQIEGTQLRISINIGEVFTIQLVVNSYLFEETFLMTSDEWLSVQNEPYNYERSKLSKQSSHLCS